ncbi:hypothetical protein, partial [Pseudomonas fluorescens]|uniref:hypothetical protein n=1 Tax=Pseudomonas fluorescens TaxID=294 RepID=UPI001C82B013
MPEIEHGDEMISASEMYQSSGQSSRASQVSDVFDLMKQPLILPFTSVNPLEMVIWDHKPV